MTEIMVIINEQHSLKTSQIELLNAEFPGWQILPVSADGWNLRKIGQEAMVLAATNCTVIFASPIPAMIKECMVLMPHNTWLLHNDKRIKKELPGGKIISVVADDGWVLV